MNIEELEKKINYSFKNKALLTTALTHPSLRLYNRILKNYERLELIGDAVLSLIIIEILLKKYIDSDEGKISIMKSNLVCTEALYSVGKMIGIEKYILMSNGEEKMNGRNNKKNIENVVESLVGAIYLDNGLDKARDFIKIYWKDLLEKTDYFSENTKSRLQEWLQKNGYPIPNYELINVSGDVNTPFFTIELKIDNIATFQSKSYKKKDAEKDVAKKMIEYIYTNIDKNI